MLKLVVGNVFKDNESHINLLGIAENYPQVFDCTSDRTQEPVLHMIGKLKNI